jgi:crotonobetainyl-CoA:carnitine CoA-transferase CaiB-like acyl-CoA transferase
LEIGDPTADFCGMLLAGEGVNVIKVEPPEGSRSRNVGPFLNDVRTPDQSLFFWMYNRGKRGISLDLTHQDDRQRFLELSAAADVIIDGQGLGVMDGLGVGYDTVSSLNNRVIYCSITPFGLTGPWKNFKGCDLVHQALGGSAYCIGYDQIADNRWDTPPLMPQAWHSFAIAAEHAAVAIAAAVIYRDHTDSGQLIDVSIHDACAQSTEATVTRYIYNGRNQVRGLPQQFRCGDNHYLAVVLNFLHQADLPRLVELLKRGGAIDDQSTESELIDRSYIQTSEGREKLGDALTEWAASQSTETAFLQLQDCGVICGPVHPPEDLIEDAHSVERQDFVEIDHPELNRSFVYPRQPSIRSETPWRWGPRAPLLGEHNGESF